MKKNLALFVLALFFTGCATMAPAPSVCDQPGAEKSWLCAQVSRVEGLQIEDVDIIIRVAIVRGLKKQSDKDRLSEVLGKIESALTENITYRYLIEFVGAELTGPEIELISRRLIMFDSTRFISNFDKDLILKHIAKLRTALE